MILLAKAVETSLIYMFSSPSYPIIYIGIHGLCYFTILTIKSDDCSPIASPVEISKSFVGGSTSSHMDRQTQTETVSGVIQEVLP
jgi:hypothetical protein